MYPSSHASPFVAVLSVELKNEPLLLGGEGTLLEIGSEVVGPAEPAALAAAGEPGVPLHRIPVPFPVLPHVLRENRVLHRRPGSLLQRDPSSMTSITLSPTYPRARLRGPNSLVLCSAGVVVAAGCHSY